MRRVPRRRAAVAPPDEAFLRAWLEELAARIEIPPRALRPPRWTRTPACTEAAEDLEEQ
jgi:hypothetical protein